jgi:uncharacterized protein YbaR (Trm112 family)
MLQPELLEILACPQCKDRVVLDAKGEFLRCERCRVKYPVREDIPIMLVEEAVPDSTPEST